MREKNSVEDAIDKARRVGGDIRPLRTLLGAMILKRRQVDAEELNEVRSRVYVSLSTMFDKGQPSQNIARQLGKVVNGAIVDEHRFRAKLRADVPFDDLFDKTMPGGVEDSMEDVVIDQEAIREIKAALAKMEQSDSQSDRKYHAAILAKVTGKSVTVAVRRFEAAESPNAAAQTLRRAWERLKALYMATKGEKAS